MLKYSKKNGDSTTLLKTVQTDENGYFSCYFDELTNISDNESYDIVVRVCTKSTSFNISRDWLFSIFTGYYFKTTISNIKSNNSVSIKDTTNYSPSNMTNNAFCLSQAFVTAQRFMDEMLFSPIKILNVIYPFLETEVAFCYDVYAGLAKEFFDNFDVAMHEYGHFVEGELGTYGCTAEEIAQYFPDHTMDGDNFYEKEDKQYAMKLTWSESWATAFAQIAQKYYLEEYEGKVLGYGDFDDDGDEVEDFSPDTNSCEAQEHAVIAFLWDLFDEHSASELDDNISLTYLQWMDITTKNYIQTLTEFIDVIDTYYPSYRNQIGEILEKHQISPGSLTITNASTLSQSTPPMFNWKINGSINNPNNYFQLVFYNEAGNIIYETPTLSLSLAYYQSYTYTISDYIWTSILAEFNDIAVFSVSVKGYNTNYPMSGPYYSKYLTVNIILDSHICSYNNYQRYSRTHHKSSCPCGNFIYDSHSIAPGQTGRWKSCYYCRYLIDTGSDIVIVGPYGLNSDVTENVYLILDEENNQVYNTEAIVPTFKENDEILEE